jgi:hypothetical protein
MAAVHSTIPSTNGHVNRLPRAAKAGRKAAAPRGPAPSKLRKPITVTLGCGIPCLSLALSSIGGRLILASQLALGAGFMGLCCSVLAVSLSHLAWAVRDITKSAPWQAWLLAIAVDLSLVLGELAGVAGYDSWVVTAVMVCVTATSAVLNVYAFLRHCK